MPKAGGQTPIRITKGVSLMVSIGAWGGWISIVACRHFVRLQAGWVSVVLWFLDFDSFYIDLNTKLDEVQAAAARPGGQNPLPS